jgi:hypothetical protein
VNNVIHGSFDTINHGASAISYLLSHGSCCHAGACMHDTHRQYKWTSSSVQSG